MKLDRKLIFRMLAAAVLFGLCMWWGRQNQTVISLMGTWSGDIILDAGHGGEDGGAVSPGGVKESLINLEIVLKLDQMLGLLGQSPVLLRDSDRSLHDETAITLREKKVSDLKNRATAVNNCSAGTLVSIHQNSYPEPKYKGTQVFYAPTGGSEELARAVQQAIASSLQLDNSRVEKQIPDSVYLMNHIENRAILVECGFLTNPEDEQLLQQEDYQRKLALVLATALAQQLG